MRQEKDLSPRSVVLLMGEYGGVCGTLSVDAGPRLPHMAEVKRNHYASPALIPA